MKRTYLIILLTFILLLTSCKSCKSCKNNNENNKPEYFIEYTTESIDIRTFEIASIPINTNAPQESIVYSSSDESVAKIENSLIVPISKGSAVINATINNDKYASLIVNVADDGSVPYLDVDEEISLFKNSSYNITPSVSIRGKNVSAKYKYIVDDQNIVNVDESGKITSLKDGSTNITILADYNGYTGDEINSLKSTIKINVYPEIILSINVDKKTINNKETIVNGIKYSNTTTLSGSLIKADNIQDIFLSEATFVSTNPSVAYIDNNKIVGISQGKTYIYAKATIDNVEYTSNKVLINVEKPLILVDNNALDIDLYKNEIALDTSFMLNDDTTILNIYDEESKDLPIYENGKLKDYNKLGNRKWIIESTNNSYLYNVTVCSKIIYTKEELASLNTYAKDVVKGYSGIVSFDGYFILGNNINMKGVKFKTICGITTGATSVRYNGFMGTFDGRGYTIENATVSAGNGGLFATMNQKAIVKNVSFKNATVSGDSGLISSNFGGTIENVYVEGKLTCTHASAQSPSSLLASTIYDGAKVKNTIVLLTNASNDYNYCSAIGMLRTAKEEALENVFVIGTSTKVLSTQVGNKYDKFNLECNGQFVNYKDLLSKDLSKFNSHWLFGESGITFAPSH